MTTTAAAPSVSTIQLPPNRERELSAPAMIGGKAMEGVMLVGSKDDGHHGVARRDRMEQRVRDAIFNIPFSATMPPPPHSQTHSTVPHFYSSYHGESSEQLRNRSRQTQSRDSGLYNSTGAYSSSSSNTRPLYTPTYPPHSSPPPSFVPSPSPTPTSHISPSSQSHPNSYHHNQTVSQEWTEYTSASSERTNTAAGTLSPTPSNPGQSHQELDISEFDPIHS